MTCGRGDHHAKLGAIIDVIGIDSVCAALRLDLERIRALSDGTGEIDAESAAWIDSEVLRLEEGGFRVEVAETPEPEGIGSDDATAEDTELTVPEAGPHDVEDYREALRAMVEGVHMKAFFTVMTHAILSKYDRALAGVLRSRLELALHFRQPLSRPARQGLLRSIKENLRTAENQLKQSGGPFHWLRKPRDFSGEELYHQWALEWCESSEADPELARGVELKGIGRVLYPDSYATTMRQLTRLDEGKRRAAEALIEAILLAEEAEFRSPLPCEEELAAAEIKIRMELMLIMEIGIAPPSGNRGRPLSDYLDMEQARAEKRSMVDHLRRSLVLLDVKQRKCRKYKGRRWALDFFRQLIEESGAEECQGLDWIITRDMLALCRDFHAGRGPQGVFNAPDVQPGPGN